MSPHFIPAGDLSVIEGREVELLPGGVRRIAPGGHGIALYGPYLKVEAGIYRVALRAKVVNSDARSYFDVDAETRLRASRFYRAGAEFYAHIYRTDRLELRFFTDGEEVIAEGVELEPVLLDAAPASAEVVRALCERAIATDSEPEAVFRLLDRLAYAGEVAQAEALRARFLVRPPTRAPSVVAAFCELHVAGGTALSTAAQGPFEAADIEPFLASRPLRHFDLPGLRAYEADQLRALGYDPALLQGTRLHRSWDEPRRGWRDLPDPTVGAAEFTSRPPLFERFAEVDRSHQWDLARGEGMAAYCPISGRPLRSRHGFCQPYGDLPFLIYRFEGDEVFYVATGHSSNAKMFVYLPETHTLIDLRDPWLRFFDNSHVLSFFLTNLLSHPQAVRAYLNAPTRPAATVGNNTYGHMVWATLTGLEFAAERGLLDGLAEVVEIDNYFFPVQPLFPELADKPTTRFRKGQQAEAFLHCVERGLLPVNFTDLMFDDALVERIHRRARAHAGPAGTVPLEPTRPLLYINLRAHNKIWLNQGAGYADILNGVHARYGRAAAFIDGMPDCRALYDDMRARTHPDIALHDGLTADFYDKVNWAVACDAYVCPIGSSLALVQWIADKPGVAHAEHAHLEQLNWLHLIRPGVRNPVIPSYAEIVEVGEGMYCNYNLDWHVLLDLLTPILDGMFAPVRHA